MYTLAARKDAQRKTQVTTYAKSITVLAIHYVLIISCLRPQSKFQDFINDFSIRIKR